MKKTSISFLLGAALLLNTANAAAFSMPPVATSDWATAEVQHIYENGLVSPEFDLGKDYTMPITRGQFARLAVDLISAETGKSIPDIISAHKIILEAPISGDIQQPDESVPAAPDETTLDNAEQLEEGNKPVLNSTKQLDQTQIQPYPGTNPLDSGLPPVVNGSFQDTNSV